MTESTIFVGRERERERVRLVLAERDRSAVCVMGRSKMGKTFLLQKIHEEVANESLLYSSFHQFRSTLEDPTFPFVSALAELVRGAKAKEGTADKARRLVEALASDPKKTALRMGGAFYRAARASILSKVKEYFQYEEIVEEATSILEEKIQQVGKYAELDELLDQSRPAVISSYLGLLENLSDYTDPEDRYLFIFDQIEHAPETALDFLLTLVRELPTHCFLLFSLNIEHPRGSEIWGSKKSELRANDVEEVEVGPFGQEEIRALIQARGKVVPPLPLLQEAERATGGRPLSLDDWVRSEDFDKGIIRGDKKFQDYQLERLEACSEEARKLAGALALLPGPLPGGLKDYAVLFKTSAFEIGECLKELVRHHLFLCAGGQYWFVHEETMENIQNAMDPAVREDLAKELVEGFQSIDPEVMEKHSPYGPLVAALLSWTDKHERTHTLNSYWGGFFYSISESISAWAHYQRALRAAEALREREKQGIPLNRLGSITSMWGRPRDALLYYERALSICREVGDGAGVATTLNNIGMVYNRTGQNDKALDYYNKALSIYREVGNRAGEATTLNNIGGVYFTLSQNDKALDYYNQSLPIGREVGDRAGEGTTLNNIGLVYSGVGQNDKALDYYNQSLAIRREVGDRAGEAVTLNNIGLVYSGLGQNDKALDYYDQSLAISREVGDRTGEAVALNNIGLLYSGLGQNDKALDYYNQSLPIRREVGDWAGVAATLNNIGGVYSELGQRDKALGYYNQALPISREVGDRTTEARTLNNMGMVYSDLGQNYKALDYFNQGLLISREVQDRTGEAATLNNMGLVNSALGHSDKALDCFNQALLIFREAGNKAGEAGALTNISIIFAKQIRFAEAISLIEQVVAIEEKISSPNLEKDRAALEILRSRMRGQ